MARTVGMGAKKSINKSSEKTKELKAKIKELETENAALTKQNEELSKLLEELKSKKGDNGTNE